MEIKNIFEGTAPLRIVVKLFVIASPLKSIAIQIMQSFESEPRCGFHPIPPIFPFKRMLNKIKLKQVTIEVANAIPAA